MKTMTRAKFLKLYRECLTTMFPDAKDKAMIDQTMKDCAATLEGANSWCVHDACVIRIWRSMGGQRKPTLRALRLLPTDD